MNLDNYAKRYGYYIKMSDQRHHSDSCTLFNDDVYGICKGDDTEAASLLLRQICEWFYIPTPMRPELSDGYEFAVALSILYARRRMIHQKEFVVGTRVKYVVPYPNESFRASIEHRITDITNDFMLIVTGRTHPQHPLWVS
jgi:hypothetical protein